jgi:DNA-binding response OmpR family regulator
MIKKILIVDDNQEMLFTLKDGLEKYSQDFSVVIASDGLDAVEKLANITISLVVTDLKMPRMDGFSLLAHIIEKYPGVPVIMITGYITPQMEHVVRQGGAAGYIEKPFMVDALAEKIIALLKRVSEGGTLQNVSTGMFLQLVEMEQKTCTIWLTCRNTAKQGVLFFRTGMLIEARVDGLTGESAALEIFQWDEVDLSIQNSCPVKVKTINKDLQAIYLEALRLKDEAVARVAGGAAVRPKSERDPAKKPVAKAGPRPQPVKANPKPVASESKAASRPDVGLPKPMDRAETLRQKIESNMGRRSGLEDIYQDRSYADIVLQMLRLGKVLDAGELKLAYINKRQANDFIVLPDEESTVLAFHSKCPRDRIIQILTR